MSEAGSGALRASMRGITGPLEPGVREVGGQQDTICCGPKTQGWKMPTKQEAGMATGLTTVDVGQGQVARKGTQTPRRQQMRDNRFPLG